MIEALIAFVLGFIALGIQEKYLKSPSARALEEIEKLVLPLVFERLDPVMPDLLVEAKQTGSDMVLGTTILKEIVSAAEEAEIDLSGQVGPAYQRFLELYNPVANARRLRESGDDGAVITIELFGGAGDS